jgi:hypothetical protein
MQAAESIDLEARLAGRATGAMFFSVFGAVWLEVWAQRTGAGLALSAAIAAAALVLLAGAWLRYRRYAPALAQLRESSERRRSNRIFHLVNIGQWVLILVLANVLVNIGLGAWVVPMGITVIGLHFVPLAHAFRYRAHYVTAAAMVALAALYPLLAQGGPAAPVGFLGAGSILWLSAAWALRSRS